ncbi:MAG: hypothetical protein Q9162_007175 [Coniocarpon cinnabarinum]
MASNDNTAIPIVQPIQQEALKLIELPSEVLASLSSSSTEFVIKSAGDDDSNETVLCSADKTWNLRQVQSSNSLTILSPVQDNGNASTPPAMKAAASCNGTVEVFQAKAASDKSTSPNAWLSTVVPLYEGGDPTQQCAGPSKPGIMSEMPFSDGEISRSWKDLCAFSVANGSFRPSPACILHMWKTLLHDADTLSVDLTGPFALQDILVGSRGAAKYPTSAYEALLCKSTLDTTGTDERLTLRPENVIAEISRAISQSRGLKTGPEVQEQVFDLMPVAWQQRFDKETISRICSLPPAIDNKSVAESSASVAKPSAKRNWHEKLKKTKR